MRYTVLYQRPTKYYVYTQNNKQNYHKNDYIQWFELNCKTMCYIYYQFVNLQDF